MKLAESMTIRTKLSILFTLLIGFISLCVYIYVPAKIEKQAVKAIIEKGQSIAKMIAFRVSPALFFEDVETMDEVLSRAKQNKDVVYVVVTNDSGNVIAEFNKDRADEAHFYQTHNSGDLSSKGAIYKTMTPVTKNDRVIGLLYLGLSLEELHAGVIESRQAIALVCMIIFGLGMLAVFGISTLVTKPLSQMVDTVERIGEGDLTQRAMVPFQDEMGALAKAFNNMVDNLESTQRELKSANRSLKKRAHELQNEVNERIRMEAALRKSERKYRVLFDQIPNPIFIFDKGTKYFVDCNKAVLRTYNYSKSELKNMTPFELHPPEDLNKVKDNIDVRNFDKPFAYTHLTKDGRQIDVEILSNETEYQGRPAWISIVRDVTERKRVEKIQSVLFQISEATSVSSNLAELLQIIRQQLGTLIDTANFYVALYDERDDMYSFPYCVDEYEGSEDFTPQQLKKSLTDYVRRTGKPLLADEQVHEQLIKEGEVALVGTPSPIWLGVPLKTAHGVIGVVVVQSYTDGALYSKRDLELLTFVSGYIAMVIERKQAEAELRENEEKYSNLFHDSNDGIFLHTLDGTIVEVNQKVLEQFGYTKSEITSIKIHDLHPRHALKTSRNAFKKILKDGFVRFEIDFKRKNGEVFPAEVSASLFGISGDQVVQGIVRDITYRRRSEEKQVQLLEELASVNRELKDFAYVVSHDLKAPLRAIGSLSDWLLTDYRDKLDEEGKELITLLDSRVKRMHNLIEGILQYSSVGRIKEEKVKVDLNQAVEDVIDLIAPSENIEIKVENKLPSVVFEKTRIEQVFQNLISNSVKYMDKPRGQIKIGCAAENGYWKFNVADNGPGIEDEHFEKIFQIFQTLTSRDEFESTGVGLALVKKIIEMYGGKIWVESEVGTGTTFFFTLPRNEN